MLKDLEKKGALYNLINQVKYPGMYDECLCLGCKGEVKFEVEDKIEVVVNDNGNQGTCFADVNDKNNINANDNVNDNDSDNDDDNDNGNDNENGNVNFKVNVGNNDDVNDNDNVNQGTDRVRGMPTCLEDKAQSPFAVVNDNQKNEIVYHRGSYTNGETWVKPNPRSGLANNNSIDETASQIRETALQINVNDSLQPWQ